MKMKRCLILSCDADNRQLYFMNTTVKDIRKSQLKKKMMKMILIFQFLMIKSALIRVKKTLLSTDSQ